MILKHDFEHLLLLHPNYSCILYNIIIIISFIYHHLYVEPRLSPLVDFFPNILIGFRIILHTYTYSYTFITTPSFLNNTQFPNIILNYYLASYRPEDQRSFFFVWSQNNKQKNVTSSCQKKNIFLCWCCCLKLFWENYKLLLYLVPSVFLTSYTYGRWKSFFGRGPLDTWLLNTTNHLCAVTPSSPRCPRFSCARCSSSRSSNSNYTVNSFLEKTFTLLQQQLSLDKIFDDFKWLI